MMNDPEALDPIIAAIRAGSPSAAERLCRTRLETMPDNADVLLPSGVALQQQGRPDDAVPMYRRIAELHPGDGVHWCNYATALRMRVTWRLQSRPPKLRYGWRLTIWTGCASNASICWTRPVRCCAGSSQAVPRRLFRRFALAGVRCSTGCDHVSHARNRNRWSPAQGI